MLHSTRILRTLLSLSLYLCQPSREFDLGKDCHVLDSLDVTLQHGWIACDRGLCVFSTLCQSKILAQQLNM